MQKHKIAVYSIFGILLPLAALVVELLTGMCAEILFNPIPTWFCAAVVASIPLANFILLVAAVRGKWLEKKLLRVIAGYVLTISAFYSVPLLPFAVLGILLMILTFWLNGIGFVGLLPSAPIGAFWSAFLLRRRLVKGPGFFWGFLIAFLALAIPLVDAGVMVAGVNLAQSSDREIAARGIRLCRLSMRKDVLEHICRGSEANLISSILNGNFILDGMSTEARKNLFYRVTGESPDQLWIKRWNRGLRGVKWDLMTGADSVGDVLEGLSLIGSAYDTTIDKAAGIGYGEWTMTFLNSHFSDREARMRIALPHGAVVSRVTLWINGEECEAAFGTKGQVRRAYEAVVSRNRDPLLVNFSAPDQIQAQCFPVPSSGEMKIRLGFTVPLDVARDGRSARMLVPVIVERNFDLPADLLGLPEEENMLFDRELPRYSYYAPEEIASLLPTNSVILQTAGTEKEWNPERVAVVLDTSAAMKEYGREVFSELAGLPDCQKEFWIAGDFPPARASASLEWKTEREFSSACEGGRFNLPVLLKALDSLRASGKPAALVWIHAGQPVKSNSGDVLAVALAKAGNVRFYNLQMNEGRCAIFDSLPQSDRIVSLIAERIAASRSGREGDVLSAVFREERWNVARAKVPRSTLPDGAVAASKHLGRLWAAAETARIFRPGQAPSVKEAQDLALPWNIVTPVTGAVVLETKKQYEENGLEAADPNSVPVVPEPSAVFTIAIALCVVLCAAIIRSRCSSRRA